MRFKEYLFLLEHNMDKTWEAHGAKIKARMAEEDPAAHGSGDHHKDLFDSHIQQSDPTPQKKYGQWIARAYANGGIERLDHITDRVRPALETFNLHRARLEKKDINQYKGIAELEQAVAPYVGELSNKKKKEAAKNDGTQVVHRSHGVTIRHIQTEPAACLYGKNTKWCTAYTTAVNQFNHYNAQGPVHFVQHGNDRYQIHNESDQLMNVENQRVSLADLSPNISMALAASKHPVHQEANIRFNNPLITSDQILPFQDHKNLTLRLRAAEHPNVSQVNVDKAFSDKSADVHIAMIENGAAQKYIEPHHLKVPLENGVDDYEVDKIFNHPKANSDLVEYTLNNHPEYASEAIASRAASLDQLERAIDHHDPDVASAVFRSPHKLSDNIIVKGLKHSSATVAGDAAGRSDLTPSQIDVGLDHQIGFVRHKVVSNNIDNLSPDNLTKAMNDSNPAVVKTALRNTTHLNPQHLETALTHEDSSVRTVAAKSKELSPDQISGILDQSSKYHKGYRGDDLTLEMLRSHEPRLNHQHIDTVLNSGNTEHKVALFQNHSHAMSSHHIDRGIQDSSAHVRFAVAEYSKASVDQIDKLLDDEYDWVRSATLGQKNMTAPLLSKAIRKTNSADVTTPYAHAVVNHPAATAETVALAASHESPRLNYAAAQHHLLPNEIRHKMVNSTDHVIRASVSRNPALSDHELRELLTDPHSGVSTVASGHPNVTEDHLTFTLNHVLNGPKETVDSSFLARTLAANPKFNDSHRDLVFNSKDDYMKNHVARMQSDKLTHDQITKVLSDPSFDEGSKEAAFSSPNISHRHIEMGLDSEHHYVAAAAASKASHPDHIEKALNHPSTAVLYGVLNNPHLPTDRLLDIALNHRLNLVRMEAQYAFNRRNGHGA